MSASRPRLTCMDFVALGSRYSRNFRQSEASKTWEASCNATGTDVFVGPATATAMAGIKKALVAPDSIVTVSGPVGCGKTTLVTRALEALGENRKIVVVARMRLDSDDVLDLLLGELDVAEKPNGTIRKFAAFRRHLKELASNSIRVVIAVEDAIRLGADTLAEVEALTAADAGESDGANVVLMGDETLQTMLTEAQLVRTQQRIRQRHTITPLSIAELRGYLRHCFRLAGGDFEQIFEANAAELLHHVSNGVPRIANNLIESAMTAAADQDIGQVSSTLLARVAENEFGLSTAGFVLTTQPESVAEPVAAVVPELVPKPAIVFAEPYQDKPAEQDKPVEPQVEPEIPELIQDTLPDLEILAPELAAAAAKSIAQADAQPTSESESEPVPAPVLKPEGLPIVDSTGEDVPAWDRDPTIAELKPDLAALEQAMAFAQRDEPATADVKPKPVAEPKAPEEIPEITLDHAISQRIENNLIDEPGEISAPAPEKSPVAVNGSGSRSKRSGMIDCCCGAICSTSAAGMLISLPLASFSTTSRGSFLISSPL